MAVQNIEIAREEKEATEALEAAAPALAAAQEALKNISNKDLSEVKSMAKPAEAIVLVCQMTFHFMFKDGKDDSWAAIKSRLLSNMKLLDDLKTYEIYKCKHE